jgi:hypothetical protein
VADTVRRLPASVLTAVAVLLLGLGGIWWVRSAPPPPAATPANSVVAVRFDDGRVLTYQTGPPSLADLGSQRHCQRSLTRYPTMRVVGQDAPPVFVTGCG